MNAEVAPIATFNPPLAVRMSNGGAKAWVYAVNGDQWLVQSEYDPRPHWTFGWAVEVPLPVVAEEVTS